jgi:hypothetical protein
MIVIRHQVAVGAPALSQPRLLARILCSALFFYNVMTERSSSTATGANQSKMEKKIDRRRHAPHRIVIIGGGYALGSRIDRTTSRQLDIYLTALWPEIRCKL